MAISKKRENAKIIWDELNLKFEEYFESNYPELKTDEEKFEKFLEILPQNEPWIDLENEPTVEDIEKISESVSDAGLNDSRIRRLGQSLKDFD